MPRDALQLAADFLRTEDEIDGPSGDGAVRHAVEARRVVLGEGDTSLGFDGLRAEGSVGGGAGEDDADSAAPLIFRQRTEECVDRHDEMVERSADVQDAARD